MACYPGKIETLITPRNRVTKRAKRNETTVCDCNPALSLLVLLASRKVTFTPNQYQCHKPSQTSNPTIFSTLQRNGVNGVYQSEWKSTTTKI